MTRSFSPNRPSAAGSFSCGTLLWLLAVSAAHAQQTSPLVFNPRTVIPNPMPAIVNPDHIGAADVTNEVRDADLVLGVVVNGAARAYPISMLTGPRREIINDQLGGHSIAATW